MSPPGTTNLSGPGLLLCAALALTALSGCRPTAEPTRLRVVASPADPGRITAVLTGEGAAVAARPAQGPEEPPPFRVELEGGPAGSHLLAELRAEPGRVTLEPKAPLTRGLSYRAVFDGPAARTGLPLLVERYTVPADDSPSPSRVTGLSPAQAQQLPENLLKLYVHFTHPMGEGDLFRHVRLLDSSGKPVEQPFREVELWDPEHRRLTLWINPGRTKQALGLSESLGPVLVSGRRYTLEVGPGLKDQNGRRLGRPWRRELRIGPADRTQPAISRWRITIPRAGTPGPLVVRFDEPMDAPLATRLLRVEGVQGQSDLSPDGRTWRFIPEAAWRRGEYVLVAGGELEDLAGNSLARPFETSKAENRPTPSPGEHRRGFRIP